MKQILIITFLIIISLTSNGQDRVFNYTYQSVILNPGQREIEVWNTVRSGREYFYRALDTRLEFEFGIANNLQVAFYLNATNSAEELKKVSELGIGTVEIEKESEFSISNEWKYKIADPVANAIGFALYGEITIAPEEFELEAKLIFDKKIGRTMHAFNIVAENEWETEIEKEKTADSSIKEEVENEFEFGFEFDYGFSYNFNSNWNAGFELRNKNSVEEGEWENSVLYGGPGFSYAKGPIWINFTVLPQICALKAENGDTGYLLLESNEKIETRLLFSYVF